MTLFSAFWTFLGSALTTTTKTMMAHAGRPRAGFPGLFSGLLSLLFMCLWSSHTPCTAVVTIEDNGYKGLVVAIQKDLPESPELIQRIKDTLTEASAQLHRMTRHRAYFEEVTIVVPPNWTPNADYEVVQGGDRFARAEVRVDEANDEYGDQPYTLQTGECGESGEYIHLTPAFLLGDGPTPTAATNDTPQADAPATVSDLRHWPYGHPARVLVHEWAHLRYGTFDEHGYLGDEQSPPFYMDAENMIRPTGCADDLRGWLRDMAGEPCIMDINGMPNENCQFYPEVEEVVLADEENSEKHGKTSVMYLPALDSADGFCDDQSEDRKHNPFAPNKQNLMCQGRSTWDVVSNHEDFKDGRNPPKDLVTTIPRFRVIQPKKNQRPTFVLVLDISGSMRGRRMELLKAATSRFIKYQLADFCTVGMVAFSTDSRILANMTTVEDTTREVLLTQVPLEDDTGFTAIGKGILEGLQLLRKSREPTEGTLILLVSDGEENVEPYVNNVLQEIHDAKVIINTVAFGRHASKKLEKLVKITGGRGFFYDDEKVSHKMLDTAFIESAATHADIDLQPVEVINQYFALEADQEHDGHFVVDKDIGKSTDFQVTYGYPVAPEEGDPLEVLVWSPQGKKYSSSSKEYSSDRNTMTINMKFAEAEPGKWKFWVKNKRPVMEDVTILVKSETKDIKEQPIRVRAWVSDVDFNFPSPVKIYAEVKKGYHAIVDASVIASVGRPQGDPWIMRLTDNGAGADVTEGDGIYSAYFAHFNGSGRYSVEAVVLNNGRARINLGTPGQSRAPRLPILRKEQYEMLDAPHSSFAVDELQEPTKEQILEEMERKERRMSSGGGGPRTLEPVAEFERYSSAGAFRLEEWKAGDFIKPSRVTDLRVVKASLSGKTVHLEWTSPGDDLEDGRAVLAEVRYHHNPMFLLQSFGRATAVTKLLDGDFRPPEGRQRHTLTVEMPPESELQLNVSNFRLYFAVRVHDEAGNIGDVSNLALAHFQDPMEHLWVMGDDSNQLQVTLLAILAAIVVVILAVAVIFIACKLCANRQKKYECQTRAPTGKSSKDHRQMDKLLV